MFGNNPFREQWAAQQVQEGKFVIPEEIPANERTAFHGAAAAAAKAGKKSFKFGGKSHPVTMKKDTANAIADSVKETVIHDIDHTDPDFKALLKKHGVKHTVVQKGPNRGYDSVKLTGKNVKGVMDFMKKNRGEQKEGYMKDLDTEKSEPTPRSDKKVAADFKKRRKGEKNEIEMNPKMDNDKKAKPMETKESTIREKLMAVLEGEDRKKHTPNEDKAEKMKDNRKGKGAQDMMAPADDAIANPAVDEPERIKQDAAKMTSNVKNAKMRTNDNPKGDKNIIPGGTPMKDPAAMKAESYNKNADIMAAYASMYDQKTDEAEIKEDHGSGTEDDYKYNVHGYTGERGDEGHHAMLKKAKERNVKVTTGRSNPNTGSSTDGKHIILRGKKKDVDHVIDNHIGRDE